VLVLVGALVLLALAFLTPMFYYIPDAALAAVIIMAVTDMINFSMLKHLWNINSTSLSCITTLPGSLLRILKVVTKTKENVPKR